MEEAREKPKILLLRRGGHAAPDTSEAGHWARLSKALRTFTDLDERILESPSEALSELTAGFDFTFLDTDLASWPLLGAAPISRLCLVRPTAFPWNDWRAREERLDALTAHPFLTLEGFSASDLLRLVHLFLVPKRLAGVTPLMEKGTLILGEKIMERNSVGLLLDRVSTFADKLDDFTLGDRLPDLRQVLSAVLLEALDCASRKSAVYPFVDFQLAVAPRKLAVNLRFPLGGTPLHELTRGALSGTNLFWQQIWQCSDATLLTHHLSEEELEVSLLLFRPERNVRGDLRPLLHKVSTHPARAEDLLDPPNNFRFLLISELQSQENADVQLFTHENPLNGIEGLEAGLPEAVVSRLRQLTDQCKVLNEHVQRKDRQLQEQMQKYQETTRESNSRRGELVRAEQSREVLSENSERRIRDLEAQLAQLKETAAENAPARSSASLQEVVAKMEVTLRATENEKTHLRDSIAHEQRRVASLEQKYSQLYKDLAAKDREAHEMRNTINKFRREHAERPTQKIADDKKENLLPKLKELEERDVFLKQEVKKLTYKVETQEKNLRAVQNDATEKQRMLDQKLRDAKTKEVELLKRIEELTSSLKKAVKAA